MTGGWCRGVQGGSRWAYLVLRADCADGVGIQVLLLTVAAVRDAAFVCLADGDVGLLLVQSDAEALQLTGDDVLVREGLGGVDHDEDEVARASSTNDLSSTALAVLGSLNNSRQVHNLDLGSAVHESAGDGSQRLRRRGNGVEAAWTDPACMQGLTVNSYAAASEAVPVNIVSSVLLPTEGKPTRPTRVSPDCRQGHGKSGRSYSLHRITYLRHIEAVSGLASSTLHSKTELAMCFAQTALCPHRTFVPIPFTSAFSFESFALRIPRCLAVALFFWVRAISASEDIQQWQFKFRKDCYWHVRTNLNNFRGSHLEVNLLFNGLIAG